MSAATYDAIVTFLETDVRTSVNAEQPDALAVGSVTAARRGLARVPRKDAVAPLSVEIVPVGPWPKRDAGIGEVERDYVFDLKITLRSKATSDGKAQLNTLEDAARALVARYEQVSNLVIAPAGATFRRSTAELREVDDVPQSHELARAVVRAAFTFTEALAANT